MSAQMGVLYPLFTSSFLITSRFFASFMLGAVILTSSQPALIIRMLCSTVPTVSIVSVVVMLCSLMGFAAPSLRSPIITSLVKNREYAVKLLLYFFEKFIESTSHKDTEIMGKERGHGAVTWHAGLWGTG